MLTKKTAIILSPFIFILWVILVFLTDAGVTFRDAGEITTNVYFSGIAHPTGFPPYLTLAKLFTFLPFGTIYFKAALFSAFNGLISLLFLWLIIYKIGEIFIDADQLNRIIFGFIAVCFLLNSDIFLLHSTKVEIYSLVLSTALILFYFTLNENYNLKNFLLISFIGGIATGIHFQLLIITAILLVFILLKEIFESEINFIKSVVIILKRSGLGFLLFAAGYLSSIFYLYIRGNIPYLISNWDNTSSLSGLWKHISSSRIASSFQGRMTNINLVSVDFNQWIEKIIIPNLTGAIFIIAVFSLFFLFIISAFHKLLSKAKLSYFVSWQINKVYDLCIISWSLILGASFYDVFINPMGIKDFQVGFLALIFLLIQAIFYFLLFLYVVKNKYKGRFGYSLVKYLIVIFLVFYSNKSAGLINRLSDNFTPQDIVTSTLFNLPSRSIILCISDDTCGSAMYLQNCSGIRPDIIVIPRQHLAYKNLIKNKVKSFALVSNYFDSLDSILNKASKQVPVFVEGGEWRELDKATKNYFILSDKSSYLFEISENRPTEEQFINHSQNIWKTWKNIAAIDKGSFFTKSFFGRYWDNLAIRILKFNSYENAKQFLLNGIKTDPLSPSLLTNYGILAIKTGNTNEGLIYFDKTLKIDPFYSRALLVKADILFNRNKNDDAKLLYKLVLEYDPFNSKSFVGLGLIEASSGNYETARFYWEKALEINPENEEAILLLKKIR